MDERTFDARGRDAIVAPVVKEPAVVRVEDAARMLSIGRGLAYELARQGTLPGVIKLGRRYVVSRSVLERVIDGRPAE